DVEDTRDLGGRRIAAELAPNDRELALGLGRLDVLGASTKRGELARAVELGNRLRGEVGRVDLRERTLGRLKLNASNRGRSIPRPHRDDSRLLVRDAVLGVNQAGVG